MFFFISETVKATAWGSTILAMVTVTDPIRGTVSPLTVSVGKGGTQQFSATVTGTTDTTISWNVIGGASGTSISAEGLLTVGASETATVLTVKAFSTANPTKSGTAEVTVTDPVSVTITPSSVAVGRGATQQFSARVSGGISPSQNVEWSIINLDGSTYSGSSTININGLLTIANDEDGTTLTVTATSDAAPTREGTATVTVVVP